MESGLRAGPAGFENSDVTQAQRPEQEIFEISLLITLRSLPSPGRKVASQMALPGLKEHSNSWVEEAP